MERWRESTGARRGLQAGHALGAACALALCLLLLSPFPVYGQAETHTAPLRFGVVPQQVPRQSVRNWMPLLRYLEAQTGYPLQFQTARDIPTFEQRLLQGEYDLAYLNPYHYIVFNATTGYLPLARENVPLQGIVVVQAEAAIRDLKDLRGTTIAFPGPGAVAATLVPRAYLARLGIPHEAQFVGSHDSVYRAVARGLFPAGGGIRRTYEALDPEVSGRLRVLWSSPPLTPHPVVVHPRVEAEAVDALRAALLQMGSDPGGRAILKTLGFQHFEPAEDADYDDVRALDLALPRKLGK
ncbi:phosphate/phosphite/phosphonate ABC transporter substrate-binding protein [Ectothiorhodospiraceae bacterium 2226]|nr:phosphate/phosphite/phosphonate ABC transporter substrate-binding protein [Ectothiorhodospiraceae bacterium 2226]